MVILIYYINPILQTSENIPSDTLLPSEEEIKYPELNSTIEELELAIFDKEQKIIFRDKQINKFKEELKILVKENESLSTSLVDLDNQLSLSSNNILDDIVFFLSLIINKNN